MPPDQAAMESLHACRIGPKPLTTVLSSRLVALSRSPDARRIVRTIHLRTNGTEVDDLVIKVKDSQEKRLHQEAQWLRSGGSIGQTDYETRKFSVSY
jgi:hypothetical protein